MKIAFYAPMNAADDEVPSGDRLIARRLIEGLEALGHEVVVVSRLKSWAREPDALVELKEQAAAEVSALFGQPFHAWLTYHVYYKAPDLIGPWIARAQGIPYFIAEASLSPKRADGPWAEHYRLAKEAILLAACIFCISPRDRPALEAANLDTLLDLPPWVDTKIWQANSTATSARLRLVTTAMMREGDKVESFKLMAESLEALTMDWVLEIYGDGPAREKIEALFKSLPDDRVTFRGIADQAALARAYANADLFLWPGLNEGFGMTYLEAQAAGLACVACDGPGPRAALDDGSARLTAPTAQAFGWAIADLAQNQARRVAMGKAGRRLIEARFSKNQFLRILKMGLA